VCGFERTVGAATASYHRYVPQTEHTNNRSSMPSHRTRSYPPKSKRVVFAEWDSDLERERSERGIEFRRRVKEDSQQKKMARQQRDADYLLKAEQAYQALIQSENRGPLADLCTAQNRSNGFWDTFNLFFSHLVKLRPLGRAIRRGNARGASPSEMLCGLAKSQITFQQIRGHTALVVRLTSIAQLAVFQDAILTHPTVSSGSKDEAPQGGGVAPEDEDDEDAHDGAVDDVDYAHDDVDVDAPQDGAGDDVDAPQDGVDAPQDAATGDGVDVPPPAPAGADRGRNRDQQDQQPRRNVRPRTSG
jgi:hypothetical protein